MTSVSAKLSDGAALSGEDGASADEMLRRLIIGTWQQKRFGDRQLIVRSDGTATMIIRPEALYALAFGERIELDMFWSVSNGHIDYGVTGGKPADKVASARSLWGDHWVEKILKLEPTSLSLLDSSTKAPSDWIRAKQVSSSN